MEKTNEIFALQVSHLYKFDAVLIVYSITDRESFQFAKDVLSEINLKKNTKRPSMKRQLAANEQEIAAAAAGARPRIVILVGNKTDLERSRTVTTKGKANDKNDGELKSESVQLIRLLTPIFLQRANT